MTTGDDIKYMRRALALASLASGNTSPNPLVGAVIVYDKRIIGEGYHTMAGNEHAEVTAINSVKDKSLLKKATMYVNLEPCSHYGRTPPCAERIKKEKIPRVLVGTADPSKKVSGNGLRILSESGIVVKKGILEDECRELNKRFFTYHEKGRPYVILKWARSSDGFIDRVRSDDKVGPNWITGMEERMMVHKWRSEEDAILIGDRTACNDDPALDVRMWTGKNPRRFVLSESTDLPPGLKIFKGEPPTLIFRPGAGTLTSSENALEEIMKYMYDQEILSVIVEGGSIVLSRFIEKGLWDEARVFTGKVRFGNGLKSPVIEGEVHAKKDFRESSLQYLKPLL